MEKNNNQSLLHKLKNLYTRLFIVSLHNRIHHYHSMHDTTMHQQISRFLYKLIDEIVNEVSSTYTPTDYKHLKFINDEKHSSQLRSRDQPYVSSSVSMTLNGLSLYLQKVKAVENDPSMSEKLKMCFWDHVHAAHRNARMGDSKTAKLHIDIACNAMKSLSQYMPDAEYRDFIAEFTKELSCDVNQGEVVSS